MSTRPPWTWVAALVGLVAQTVVTAWAAVALFVDASGDHRRAQANGGFGGKGFTDDLGAAFTVLGGVLALLVAVVLAVAVALARRPGGRRTAGLIVGLVLQVPLVWASIGAVENGVGVGETVTLVGAALVVLAAVLPSTWRWCRRPVTVRRDPHPQV